MQAPIVICAVDCN